MKHSLLLACCFLAGLFPIVESQLGWTFTAGIDFSFPAVPQAAVIGAGGYVLVVRDPNAFFLRYPDVELEIVYGPYGGALNNGRELIELG